jgi:hypothetical protein
MSYQSSSDDNSSSESEGEMRILPVKKQRGRPKKPIAKAGARSGGARSGGAMSGGNSITDFLKKHKGKIAAGTIAGLGIMRALMNASTPKAHYDKPLFYGTGKKQKGGRKVITEDHPQYNEIMKAPKARIFRPINQTQSQFSNPEQMPTPHLQSPKGWEQTDEPEQVRIRMSPYEEYEKYLELNHLRNKQTAHTNRLNKHGLRLKTTEPEDFERDLPIRNKYAVRV